MDLSAFIPAIGVLAIGGILLWFTIGTQRNIRNGERLMRWLGEGLGALGPRTTLRWLGSSVAELKIVQPRHPYRDATVMIVLEPRDLGALWALSRSRGRRDFILMRLNLVRAPRFRADVVDPSAWTAGDNRRDEPEFDATERWTDVPGSSRLDVRLDRQTDTRTVRQLVDRVSRMSGGVWRVSVRPTVPHLELHLRPPDTGSVASRDLLDAVTQSARAMASGR